MHEFLKEFSTTSSKSDKISQHGYHRIYPWFLSHFKNVPIALLEIGLNHNNSIDLWKEYFKDVIIYGIDIKPKEHLSDAKLFKVDQSNKSELDNFAKTVDRKFEIIVDDGSHVPTHQLDTINAFWPILKPAGVYIIEDIETSFWGKSECYGYRFNANEKKGNLFYQFTSCIQRINKEFSGKVKKSKQIVLSENILNETEIISFAYNSIILVKKDPDFNQYYDRPYRYSGRINEHQSLKKIFKKK